MNYKNVNDYEMLYLIKEEEDVYATSIIYGKYKNAIIKIANKYLSYASNKGADIDDLIQEGYLGLNSAIKNYKDTATNLFYTFAVVCIERQIVTYCKRLSALKHESLNNCLSYDNLLEDSNSNFLEVIGDDLEDPIREVMISDFANKVLDFKNSLMPISAQVFELRMNGFTYREIAKLLDCPKTTIDGHLCQIRQKVQIKGLKDYLLSI